MKIAVLGSTGGTGKNVVARALAAGHDVVALARRPEAVATKHDKLVVAKADVHDKEAIAKALVGVDAVVLAVGPSNNRQPGDVISSAARNVVATGVKRVVLESGLMVGDARELGFFSRTAIAFFRSLMRALYEDKVIAEAA